MHHGEENKPTIEKQVDFGNSCDLHDGYLLFYCADKAQHKQVSMFTFFIQPTVNNEIYLGIRAVENFIK